MMNKAQIRAARGLLDITFKDLSEMSGVGLSTVKTMETKGIEHCNYSKIDAVKTSLESRGIEFVAFDLDDDGNPSRWGVLIKNVKYKD